MIAPFRLAFGSARVRALKSRLLGPREGAALLAARDAAAVAALVDPGAPPRASELERRSFARLVADYEKLAACLAPGRALLLALLRLHEVENLKLGWRAIAGRAPQGWSLAWRPLGRLAALRLETFERAASLSELGTALARTPYGTLVASELRAHPDDPAAAELAFDRWAAARLVEEARRLPRRESAARELALAVARERDADLLARRSSLGLTPEAALAQLSVLRDEERPGELSRLVEWTPEAGPLHASLPRGLRRLAPRARDRDELRAALARARRALCRRAFLGSPFRLGPAVAYLLLSEAEARGLGAIAESKGRAGTEGALARALSSSLLEA